MSECEQCKCAGGALAAAIVTRDPLTTAITGPLNAALGVEVEIFVTGENPTLREILRIHDYVDLLALAYGAGQQDFTPEERQFLEHLDTAGAATGQDKTEEDCDAKT